MEAWKRAALPGVAAVLIALGVLVLDWANVTDVVGTATRLSPLGDELCAGSTCAALHRGHGTWRMVADSVLVIGGLAALAMAGLAVLRVVAVEAGPLHRVITWSCVTVVGTSGMALVASGASPGEWGPGPLFTIAGGVLGLVARARVADSAFGGGRSARPIRSTATVSPIGPDPYREPSAPPAAASPRRGERTLGRSITDDERSRRPSSPAPGPLNRGVVRQSPTAPVAADATRGALRFVVTEGTLTDGGLILHFDRGLPRTVPWAQVVEVAARRMPPDPPYDKTAFVDLVVADGAPARLLPTTRLDLAALPGGVAPNTKENWRRLVALAREHNPAIAIEADSVDFFAGGRDPVAFPALKKFVEWDRRYDLPDSARTAR
ncbi:MAG TPA: hypothetical protein VHE35_21890 [Kofleriaceae bacterium]|nr:hypothetical protein [Kofleriaceae bacterium]